MKKLLTVGTYAFTGSNRQGVSYIVAEGRERVKAAVDLFCGEAERVCPQNPDVDWLMPRVELYRQTGEDAILRSAPSLILALANEDSNVKNAYFSCTFMTLYAPSLGLGTCWAGMYETLACDPRFDAAFKKHFDVPEGKAIKAILMCGVPDVKFRRVPARDPLNMTFMA